MFTRRAAKSRGIQNNPQRPKTRVIRVIPKDWSVKGSSYKTNFLEMKYYLILKNKTNVPPPSKVLQ